MEAGWLTDSCTLRGKFCTESACVPGAYEDVRVCCWLSLGDEAQQHETKSSAHTAAYECCRPKCHGRVHWRSQFYHHLLNSAIIDDLQ